jgi:hypothetical protein
MKLFPVSYVLLYEIELVQLYSWLILDLRSYQLLISMKITFVIFYFISFVSKQQANTPMFFCLIHAKGYSVWLIRCLNSVIITLYQSMAVSCCFIFIFNSFAVICILVLFCIMRLCFLSTIQLIILPYALCVISPSVFLII